MIVLAALRLPHMSFETFCFLLAQASIIDYISSQCFQAPAVVFSERQTATSYLAFFPAMQSVPKYTEKKIKHSTEHDIVSTSVLTKRLCL